MKWTINIHRKAAKQIKKLPKNIQATMLLLVRDLESNGPRTSRIWKHFGKLKGEGGNKYHCHLVKGKPTYVCCWEVVNKTLKILEVYYVGTHEKAPY